MIADKNKYIPFMGWIIEIAEEKINEHRLLKENFNSQEEFIIFTIIWLRVYKGLYQVLKKESNNRPHKTKKVLDEVITNFYINQKDKYLGITINAITRESLIPRTTVKRIIEKLIEKSLVKRNNNRLIIPTSKVRKLMENYRKFIFISNKKNYQLFNKLELEKKNYDEDIY